MNEKVEVRVEACSGNVRPYRGRAYVAGKLVATSGYCKTAAAAEAQARSRAESQVSR